MNRKVFPTLNQMYTRCFHEETGVPPIPNEGYEQIMKRFLIPVLGLLLVVLAGCSSTSSSSTGNEKYRPCPAQDLRVPCGMTPAGNYYRL
jgi:hypothetical protein